jgi:hypothetical protein
MRKMPLTSGVVRNAIQVRPTSSQTGRWKPPATPGASCAIPIRGVTPEQIRLIGYSASAGFVLTVIIDPVDHAGVTAWKSRGADLRSYLEGEASHD